MKELFKSVTTQLKERSEAKYLLIEAGGYITVAIDDIKSLLSTAPNQISTISL